MRNHLVLQEQSVMTLLFLTLKRKEKAMTYLEKWFDYNRRQKEMEALLEETIAQQSEQRFDLERVLPALLS